MNYGLYYNKEKLGDILFLIIESSTHPNKILKNDEFVLLYKEEKLIGINFLNISNKVNLNTTGLIPLPSKELINTLNEILISTNIVIPQKENSGFIVSKIIDIEEHPESDHLHICKVDCGEKEPIQVVCGGYNARLNLKTVLAKPYTFMPDGSEIIPSKLLGIESYGMLCSEKELHLDKPEYKRGIIELDEAYNIGDDFFKVIQ